MKNNFTRFCIHTFTYLPSLLLGAAIWLVSALSIQAQTVYVTPNGAGQQTGADWTNALPGNLLQSRLASATEGAEFRLAGGTYKPSNTGDRTLSFSIPSGVRVLGGYLGSGANPDQRIDFATTDQPSSTTLSGDIDNDGQTDADNSNNIVVFNQANDQTRLDGVIITGGYATTPLANPALTGTQVGGAGIYNNAYQGNSSPILENCLLIDNQTTGQGGALLNDLRLGVTSMQVINTDFYTNTAPKGGAVYYYGNLSRAYVQPVFTNCKFWNNSAESGGAVYIYSFFNKPDNPWVFKITYVNCSFNSNRASSQGGAIYSTIKSDITVTINNELVNCSVSGNSAPAGGAFVNVAVPYQSIADGYVVSPRSEVNLRNTILWNNGGAKALLNVNYTPAPGDFNTGEGKVYATYSLLESGAVLDFTYKSNVTSVSPFANQQTQQLDPCSLAINTGDNQQYNVYTQGPPTDLAGKSRIFPEGGIIDLGAYEYQIDLAITQQPASQSVVAMGSTVETTAGFTQPAANYAWYKDGVLVNGQTSATLKLTNVMPQLAGSYQLVASTGCTSLTTTAFLLTVTIPEGQSVALYVTPGGAGEKTGIDWANALPGSQLQAQLASASAGLEFRLAGGTYKPSQTGDRTRSFGIPSGVRVLGGYQGSGANPDQRVDFTNPDQPSSTTLSGDIDNDNLLDAENSNIVVRFTNVSAQTRLDGVVITGGYATTPIHFTNAVGGGAIYNNGYQGTSSPTLQNCVFSQNYTSGMGGAVYNDGGLRGQANPAFVNCRFIGNQANQGGAIYNSAFLGTSSPTFTNCSFLNNSASSGGAMYNYARSDGPFGNPGPGISMPLLVNCVLQGNIASAQGGAMFNQTEGAGNPTTQPTLVNCSLVGNSSPQGGAFYNIATPFSINNTQIFARPSLYNSLLWNNGGANTTVNIKFKNNAGGTSSGEGALMLYNCLGDPGVNDALNTSPKAQIITTSPFVSASNLQLNPCSPAINTGNNSYYTDRSNQPTDLAGKPRIYPSGGTIDIGAYEYQSATTPPLAITQQPASQSTVTAGATVETTVGLNAPADSYAWYKDGVVVTGQTSATLRLTNVQPEQAGSYSLVATSACSSVTSTAFSLSVTAPPTTPSARLTHFWLINADTDQPIQELTADTQLNLSTLPTRNLNIQAVTEPATVGSVIFNLSGQQSHQVVEGVAPYALFGDNQGDYQNWIPAVGSYSLTATPYAEAGGTGTAGTALTVNFTVINQASTLQRLARFWLINADTDQPIQELTADTQLNLSTLPTRNLNIQAVTEPATVGSVVFTLSGQQSHKVVEGVAPYALFGDNQGDYQSWTPSVGSYSLTATPYAEAGGTGAIGTALTVNFTVVNQPGSQQLTHFWLINVDTDQPIRELTDGQEVDLSSLPTRNLNIQAVTEPATVGSVVFELSGRQTRRQVETVAPYALFGDNQGDYQSWTPDLGPYTLIATPYTGAGGTDTAGLPRRVSFLVTNPGAARLAAGRVESPVETRWQLRVLGNPVTGSEVLVEVSGAEGQPLVYTLTDAGGRLLDSRQVAGASALERQTLQTGSQSGGLLLLRVSAPTHQQTIKVLKAN